MAVAVVALVIAGAGGAPTVMVKARVPVPASFVAEMEPVYMPAANGVPVIRPVLGLTPNPVGRPLAP